MSDSTFDNRNDVSQSFETPSYKKGSTGGLQVGGRVTCRLHHVLVTYAGESTEIRTFDG